MDSVVREYIEKYLDMVDLACTQLLTYFKCNCKADLLEYKASHNIWEVEINGISYQFHGSGCLATGERFWVNWDFGGGEARWCGVDPFFVAETIQKNGFLYAEQYNGKAIKELCEEAVQAGEMIKLGKCYYFMVPKEERITPEFPEEYDTLFIEQFGEKWQLKRCKLLDRFIRKANWVHSRVFENPYNYKLSFYLEGREVYSFPYNSSAYPPSATSIMSNEIIAHLKKHKE